MHPLEALGNFLDEVIPVIQEVPPSPMLPYIVDLQLGYLVSILTPEMQELANQLLGQALYPDIETFANHLREAKENQGIGDMPIEANDLINFPEERELTPPPVSDSKEE